MFPDNIEAIPGDIDIAIARADDTKKKEIMPNLKKRSRQKDKTT